MMINIVLWLLLGVISVLIINSFAGDDLKLRYKIIGYTAIIMLGALGLALIVVVFLICIAAFCAYLYKFNNDEF